MKMRFLALACATCLVGSAQASDLLTAPAVTTGGWAGAYAGAFVNFDAIDHDFTEGVLGPPVSQSEDYDTFGGGVFAGWNWQRGPWVYGVEGQVGYNDNPESLSGIAGPGDIDVGISFNGSLRGRLGRDMGNVLPYASAGIAVARLETFWPGGPAERDGTLFGGVVGVGADIKLTPRLFVRTAYDFTFYGGETLEYCGGTCVLEHDLQSHSFKLGLGVRF